MPLTTLRADRISGDEEGMRSLKVVLYGDACDRVLLVMDVQNDIPRAKCKPA